MAAASQKMINGIVEHTYCKQSRRSTKIAMSDVLEGINCFWDWHNEVPRIIKLWNMGVPFDIIATVMHRPKKDLKTLLFDLDLDDKIDIDRPGGMAGGMKRTKPAKKNTSDAQPTLF